MAEFDEIITNDRVQELLAEGILGLSTAVRFL